MKLVSLSKSEIARMYNVSVKTLSRWIKRNQALSDELEFLGYIPTQKILTQSQVIVLFKYLGFPDVFLDNHKQTKTDIFF